MWWEPRDDQEAFLGEVTSYLLGQYRRHLEAGGEVVRGVGSGPLVAEPGRGQPIALEWRPMVLVDYRSLPLQPGSPWRLPFAELDRDSLAYSVLRDWGLTPDAVVEPVGPVVPAVAPGATYTPGRATVGLPVTIGPGRRDGFLTVAHGVPARQAQGECPSPQAPGPCPRVSVSTLAGGTATGEVRYFDDSARGFVGGDDIALVEVVPPDGLAGLVRNRGTQPAPTGHPYQLLPVDVYASSATSPVIGQVNGALLQLGDRNRQWRDCWELGATQPSMTIGDSGSLALDPSATPHVFGHFVGAALSPRMAGFSHHWVQDLGRVLGRHPVLAGKISF
jgi:hypothetical protein